MQELNLTPLESKIFKNIKAKKSISKKKEIIKVIGLCIFLGLITSYNWISLGSLCTAPALLLLLICFIWTTCFLLIVVGVLFTYHKSLILKLSQKLEERDAHFR